jgi:hypothetical protein
MKSAVMFTPGRRRSTRLPQDQDSAPSARAPGPAASHCRRPPGRKAPARTGQRDARALQQAHPLAVDQRGEDDRDRRLALQDERGEARRTSASIALNRKANWPVLMKHPMARIGSHPAGAGNSAISGTRMAKRSPTNSSGGSSSSAIFIAEKFDPQASTTRRTSARSRPPIRRASPRAGGPFRSGARPRAPRSPRPRPARPSPRRCRSPAGCRGVRRRDGRVAMDHQRPVIARVEEELSRIHIRSAGS